MKVNMYNMNGKKLEKKADLPAKVFEAPINTDLMHQAFVRQMANKRQGTKKTKNRSEVSGGGHKPGDRREPAVPVRVQSALPSGLAVVVHLVYTPEISQRRCPAKCVRPLSAQL